MRLNDTIVRRTKPDDRPRKLFDGGGLYLLVNPNGSRWWKMKYRFNGIEKMLSLGVYPTVPLKLARERREAARRQIAQGLDPAVERNVHRIEVDADSTRFEMEIQNVPNPGHEGTGPLTAYSIVAALKDLTSTFRVGT